MVLWLFELLVTNGCRPLKVRRVGVDIIKVWLFRFWLWQHIWMSSQTLIELMLVSLEILGCLVCRTLKKLKFRQLDQKLWSWEVSWRILHDFQEKMNSIIFAMTLVSTYSDGRIRVFMVLRSQSQVKLGQSWRKIPSSSGLM